MATANTDVAAEDDGQRKKRKRTLTSTFESVSQRERRAPVPSTSADFDVLASAVSTAGGGYKAIGAASSSSSSSSFVPRKSVPTVNAVLDNDNYSQTLKIAADERKKQVHIPLITSKILS